MMKCLSNSKKFRPLSATCRKEFEMQNKCLRELNAMGSTGEAIERLRLLCLSHGVTGILALGRMFRRMEDEKNQQLNLEEFTSGLRETGLELNDDEAKSLFEQFADENGGLNLTKFLVYVRPPMNEARQKTVMDVFKKMDKSGDGHISIADLKKIYNVRSDPIYIAGEESEDVIRSRFLAIFELDALKEGVVTDEEFMNYYSAINASIDNDCYFDLMMRQAFKL